MSMQNAVIAPLPEVAAHPRGLRYVQDKALFEPDGSKYVKSTLLPTITGNATLGSRSPSGLPRQPARATFGFAPAR